VFASIWLATTHASAKLILVDDFNDGNDDGWTHMDSNVGDPWGPGIYDASTGAYNLSTTGAVPGRQVDSERGFMVSLWDESTDPFYSNGYVRAKLRIDTFHSIGVILFRYSGDLESGLNGYTFGGSGGQGGFSFNRITNTTTTRHIQLQGFAPAVGEEWWIEAGGVGNQLSMKVWPVGDAEPESPQLLFLDSSYSTGVLGLDANMNWGSDVPGMVNTTFDDVYFRTPDVPGDLNDDGYVTGDDFLAWQRGESPRPFSPRDLGEWEANFGADQSLPTTRVVPEPPTILLTCAIALVYRRRGKLGSRTQCIHARLSQSNLRRTP